MDRVHQGEGEEDLGWELEENVYVLIVGLLFLIPEEFPVTRFPVLIVGHE